MTPADLMLCCVGARVASLLDWTCRVIGGVVLQQERLIADQQQQYWYLNGKAYDFTKVRRPSEQASERSSSLSSCLSACALTLVRVRSSWPRIREAGAPCCSAVDATAPSSSTRTTPTSRPRRCSTNMRYEPRSVAAWCWILMMALSDSVRFDSVRFVGSRRQDSDADRATKQSRQLHLRRQGLLHDPEAPCSRVLQVQQRTLRECIERYFFPFSGLDIARDISWPDILWPRSLRVLTLLHHAHL